MPLARILTHHPERTTALSTQLQEQGYTVEVARPDQANLAPADLEIEFEICERADVLDRAAGLADELQAEVAVAPGVMQPAMMRPAAESHSAPEPLAFESAAVVEATQKRDPEREFDEAFAAQSQLPAEDAAAFEGPPSQVEVPVMERAPLPPVAFLDDHIVEIPIHAEVDRPADPVPYLAQLTPFGTPQLDAEMQKAALRAELSTDRPPVRRAPKDAAPNAPAQPSVWQRGAAITARTVANARAIAASTVESFREHALEYSKKAQIRSAEQRAAHEARLLDLEQRRAEAQQRAAELEAAREAAAARLVELVRQRDPGLPEEKQREESLRDAVLREEVLRDESLRAEKRAAPPVPQPRATRSWRLMPMAASGTKPRVPMSPQLRTVLTGAAAVSALFIVGIALGSFYPRTPLAKPAAQSSNSATAPSGGGVTVQTGGVTVKAGNQPTQGATVRPSEPAATTAAQAQPAEKPSPRIDQTRTIAARAGEQALGDDVVIRHYQRPVPTQKPKQNGQEAKLKHFSDLDN